MTSEATNYFGYIASIDQPMGQVNFLKLGNCFRTAAQNFTSCSI